MKIKTMILALLVLTTSYTLADPDVTVVAPSSAAAEGLDLMAVSELFKESENLEAFERSLNDPDNGINNLDLDGNGDVDFIRVVEEVAGDSHVIILQVALDVDEFQDVATIEVEKTGSDYNMQIHGHELIYGPDYYIVPTHIHIHAWPIISWIYRPVYRPYRSTFYFGFYPRWWRPYHPVHVSVYRTRTVHYTTHNTFVITKNRRVVPVKRVVYKPRTSNKVNKNLYMKKTTRANGGKVTKKKTVSKTRVKKGKKKTTKINKKRNKK